MNKTLPALSPAAALDGTEEFLVSQAGNPRKATGAQIATYISDVAVTEDVQDIVGAMMTNSPTLTWTYDDTAGTLVGAAVANLAIANQTSTAFDITSSAGTDITVPSATALLAGLLSAAAQTIAGVKTFTHAVVTAASQAGSTGFRLPHGTAPTTPGNGDLWTTTTGLFARINAVTKQAMWVGDAPTAHTHPSTDISNFAEAVQDVAGAMVANSATVTWVYDDTAGTLTATAVLAAGAALFAVPEDYGAIGNSTADDTVAIQSWLDSGKPLFLPNKRYKIGSAASSDYVIRISGPVLVWSAGAHDRATAGSTNQGGVLLVDADVPTTCDILLIKPNVATSINEANYYWTVEGLRIKPESGNPGRDCVVLEMATEADAESAAAFLAKLSIRRNWFGATNRRALSADKIVAVDAGGVNGLFASIIEDNFFQSGPAADRVVSLNNSGDSLMFRDNTVVGPGLGVYTKPVSGAAIQTYYNNNITAEGGAFYADGGTQIIVENNQIEQSAAYTGADDACIVLAGTVAAAVRGNNINAYDEVSCVKLSATAAFCVVEDNSMTCSAVAGKFHVVNLAPGANRNRFDSQRRMVVDAGTVNEVRYSGTAPLFDKSVGRRLEEFGSIAADGNATAALQAAATWIRSQVTNATGGDIGHCAAKLVMPSRTIYSTDCIDLTMMQVAGWVIDFSGCTIEARCTGKYLFNCTGSRWGTFINPRVRGHATNIPAGAFLLARNQIDRSCGEYAIINPQITGYFSEANLFALASETNNVIGGELANIHVSANAYCYVNDGGNVLTAGQAAWQAKVGAGQATPDMAQFTNMSNTIHNFFGTSFRRQTVNTAIWMGGNLTGIHFTNSYFVSLGGTIIKFYDNNSTGGINIHIDGYGETTGATSFIEVERRNAGTFNIKGFRHYATACHVSTQYIKIGTNVTALNIEDADIHISSGTKPTSDFVNNLAITTIKGNVWLPAANWLSVASLADFSGTFDADDLTSMRFYGELPDLTATGVPFTPTGGIAATNVQTALAELDTEKAANSIIATGSVTARTLANRFADFVNVKDFGAVGSGTGDDTAAIQAAIDAMTSGGFLIFPRGTYPVSEQGTSGYCLRIRRQIHFVGSGYDTVITPAAGVGAAVDTIRIDPLTTMNFPVIRDMFIGSKGTGTRTGRDGIRITTEVQNQYVTKLLVSGVYIAESVNGGYGVRHINDGALNLTGGMAACLFERSVFEGGLRFDETGDSNVVRECIITGDNEGIMYEAVAASGGPASCLSILDSNITAHGSPIRIVSSRLVNIQRCNIEHSAPGSTNAAVLDLNITELGTVHDNLISVFGTSDATKLVRVVGANKLSIARNRFGIGLSGLTGIDIDATSVDVVAAPNFFNAVPTSYITDLGLRTVKYVDSPWGYKEVPDGNYTILTGQPVVAPQTLTATRTWTLPAANAVVPGYIIAVIDPNAVITRANRLDIVRAGTTDTINGVTTFTLDFPRAVAYFISNGVNAWSTELKGNNYTVVGDVAYTMLGTDRVVATGVTFTAPRTWTLPAASAFPVGMPLIIMDMVGTVGAVNTLTIQRAGADGIEGAVSFVMNTARQRAELYSNGVNQWNLVLSS